MKRLSFAGLLAALMSFSSVGDAFIDAPSRDAAARHEIFSLLKERRDAFYGGDFDKFQKFEADDFTRISEDGSFLTKHEQVAYLRDRRVEQKPSDTRVIYADHDLKLDILGTVAVLTGTLSETETREATPHIQQSRFTEIWVLRHGRWLTLHNHYTSMNTIP